MVLSCRAVICAALGKYFLPKGCELMKAVIMAGGMGTRLRPICDAEPKPMTRLMGKPLLEHIIELLRRNGFSQLCITLAHRPESIMNYFGDGSDFGVSIEYRVEESPLGTAGGVRACLDFVENEDFLVISGDAACDFDLTRLAEEHKIHGGLITMALFSHREPLRYGTVITGLDGSVISFIEKPCWERVVTDLVNTGVYMLSPEALERVPEGKPFDFAQDLFPLLEGQGAIFGIPMSGYWCDIGDGKSYHRCCMDALSGRLELPLTPTDSVSGILDFSIDAPLIADSYVCPGVSVGKGAIIEGSIIHGGSVIGDYCRVKDSVIDCAELGEECFVSGSVICSGTVLPPKTRTLPGDIISSCLVPSRATLPEPVSPARRRGRGLCRELPCPDRAKLMRALSGALWEAGADFTDGITLSDGRCKVRISPVSDDSAITVEAIGGREKERLAICEKYSLLAEEFGAEPPSADIQ